MPASRHDREWFVLRSLGVALIAIVGACYFSLTEPAIALTLQVQRG